jgi:hypothetical protein
MRNLGQGKNGFGCPPKDSDPDMLIQSQNKANDNKEDKGLSSGKCGLVRQNPQTIRKQK